MNSENLQTNPDTLVTLVVAELLLNPEYGRSWISDLAIDLEMELTEDQIEAVDDSAARTLDQLAIPFVESLPEPYRTSYRESLEKRAAALHPLGEGHGKDIEL